MTDLATFLLARIAEVEEMASRHVAAHVDTYAAWEGMHDKPFAAVYWDDYDPAMLLADCTAKRRIVERPGAECGETTNRRLNPDDEVEYAAYQREVYGKEWKPSNHYPEGFPGHPCDGCSSAATADHERRQVLRLLAAPFSGHPDYRQEWTP